MTDYLVLGRDLTSCYTPLTEVEASSAEAAVRKVAAGEHHKDYSTFVAIPSRSWQPMVVQRVQITQTKLALVNATKQEAASDQD